MIPTALTRVTDKALRGLDGSHEVWTTLEGENPGGSIKDRMVLGELRTALATGRLRPGDVVSEISAGSTALSLAHYAYHFRLKCALFVPVGLDTALCSRLERLGAELHFRTPEEGYEAYEEHCARYPSWRLDQMTRPGLENHYSQWASSVLQPALGTPDLVVGAVGTGHSLLGIARGLRPSRGLCSAEPTEPRAVQGIRNVVLERFGDKDPCDPKSLDRRLEIGAEALFPSYRLRTEAGEILVTDSFRVVLGAVEHLLAEAPRPLKIFAVGAGNRLL